MSHTSDPRADELFKIKADELLKINQQLLDCIAAADFKTYERLVAPRLTSFEPESIGGYVEGLGFHKFGFDLGPYTKDRAKDTSANPRYELYNQEITSPHVHILGDVVGVVTYIRIEQIKPANAAPTVRASEETRVWHKTAEGWRLVHFHRSVPCHAPDSK